ncbi:TauD/TfdA family dioxygenase [Endozoicomonas montiporae]
MPQLDNYRQQVLHQSVLLIFKALPVEQFSPRERNFLFWYLGCQFGTPIAQNTTGDLLGRVENIEGDGFRVRGFTSCKELEMHTDRGDIVCLLCVRPAGQAGGLTSFTPLLAIDAQLGEEDNSLMSSLEQGFYYAMPYRGKQVTNYRIPVISSSNDIKSISLVRFFIDYAAELRHEVLTDVQLAALNRIDEIANSPDFKITPGLQPGDMAVWNNHSWLHSRTAFMDEEGKKGRLMLRLWLNVKEGWPMCPRLTHYTYGSDFMNFPQSSDRLQPTPYPT